MIQYAKLLSILATRDPEYLVFDREDRTGVGTQGIFGYQLRHRLAAGFPLVTGKFTPFKLVASELLWFLKGEQDKPGSIEDLHADNNHIWDEWVKEDGSFGPIYGVQWRNWVGGARDAEGGAYYAAAPVDQIKELLTTLASNPNSRRMLVTAWQPAEVSDMALPPCHVMFQCSTRPPSKAEKALHPDATHALDLQIYQRSCDVFLGVPFNIASYALLMHILAHCAGEWFCPGDLVWTGGDVHLYKNHVEQARQYLNAERFELPTFKFGDDVPRHIDNITLKHCTDALSNYTHGPAIKAEVAV